MGLVVDEEQAEVKDVKVGQLVKEVQKKLANGVREANLLPKCSEGFELYSSFPAYAEFMNEQQIRIAFLIRQVLKSAGCRLKVPARIIDLDDFLDKLVEANDAIFERVGTLLDVLSRKGYSDNAVLPQPKLRAESTCSRYENSQGKYAALLARLPGHASATAAPSSVSSASVAQKPQIAYGIVVDNISANFLPKLKRKHHALESFPARLRITVESDGEDESLTWQNDQMLSFHPYQRELDHFEVPERQLTFGSVAPLRELDETEFVYVDTVEKLRQLRDTLNSASQFAVDLEHHDYRSFLGLTCLLQISTPATDYVIDPFLVWNEMGILNEPFTNPDILKVFHGAEKDIIWLQRDFGIYVVNMFDTYCAMCILNFEKRSLQCLIQNLCGVTIDKKLQKCDWRIRPLSPAHIKYARGDTHYLLYCYDRLRQRLVEEGNENNNLLKAVFTESKFVCLRVFEMPQFNSEGYEMLLRGRKTINSRQRFAFKELWKWRDELAREEDESLHYVLPNHMLLQIAEVLPREMQGILACCSPVPPLVKRELHSLFRIISTARDRPLEKSSIPIIELASLTFDSYVANLNKMTKTKALLRCRLDFSSTRFDEGISTTEGRLTKLEAAIQEKEKKEISLLAADCCVDEGYFHLIGTEEKGNDESRKAVFHSVDEWATPFECYQIAIRQELQKEAERVKKEEESVNKEGEEYEEEKKLWSHHDPATTRQFYVEEKETFSSTEMELRKKERAEAATGVDPEMLLTKKALKKKHRMERGKADINVSGSVKDGRNEDGESSAKKSRKKNWTDAPESCENPIEYSSYNKKMFFDKPESSSAYDPFKQGSKSNSGCRGNRRGGFYFRGGSSRRIRGISGPLNTSGRK